MITEKKLREQIRNTLLEFAEKSQEVLSEQDDTLSNADFIKGLKTGAADIASSVPTALNDDLAKVLQTLTAMAQYDKSKFQKMKLRTPLQKKYLFKSTNFIQKL